MLASVAPLLGQLGIAVTGFRDAILRSLFPKTPTELRLVDEQLSQAHNATWSSVLVTPLTALFLVGVEHNQIPAWHVVFWPCAVTVGYGGAALYYKRLLDRADHSAADIRKRARVYARITMVLAAIWCAMCFDLFIPGNPASEAVMFIVIACSLSAWSSIGAYHLATAAAAMPFYLLALIAMPAADARSGGLPFAALSVTFWFLMRGSLMKNYETRERMLLLEQERTGLIENLKAAKEDSDSARLRAEHASQAKSSFLANMSHELRTPLNAILGFSEIINTKAMGQNAVDQYAEYGGYIHVSGEHLLSLINDILDLAKIEAGGITLRESEVNLHGLMDDAAQLMRNRAATGRITLAVRVERDFPAVFADERAIRQILVNLASNAIKFTPPGGDVIAFANVLSDGSVAFGIDDTGVGIALEDQDKVFENFGQGRHDAVQADKGTGLGLPIVKGLAEAHGGYVELESALNVGTRITVVLPAERVRKRLQEAS